MSGDRYDQGLDDERKAAAKIIEQLVATIDDILKSTRGDVCLQDYSRLNTSLIAGRKYVADAKKVTNNV